uniref:Uncharacterized protein n=1 Tax=mine drainage metagenome TaxID=410659 RepID=E6QLZ2_9ZZZZ
MKKGENWRGELSLPKNKAPKNSVRGYSGFFEIGLVKIVGW